MVLCHPCSCVYMGAWVIVRNMQTIFTGLCSIAFSWQFVLVSVVSYSADILQLLSASRWTNALQGMWAKGDISLIVCYQSWMPLLAQSIQREDPNMFVIVPRSTLVVNLDCILFRLFVLAFLFTATLRLTFQVSIRLLASVLSVVCFGRHVRLDHTVHPLGSSASLK